MRKRFADWFAVPSSPSTRRPSSRRHGRYLTTVLRPCRESLLLLGLVLTLTGCGTNLQDIIYNSVAAAGRTGFDLLLTDVANNVADSLARDDEADADGDAADDVDDNGENDAGDVDTGGGADLPDGAALFADNCSACHGADGASGFAPDISEKTPNELAEGFGLPNHSAISLTDEEVAAIADFLAGGNAGAGDAAAGETLFTASGCSACHCGDATGGCLPSAPSIVGVAIDRLEEQLVGESPHTGGKFDFDQAQLADIDAFLASLE